MYSFIAGREKMVKIKFPEVRKEELENQAIEWPVGSKEFYWISRTLRTIQNKERLERELNKISHTFSKEIVI